MFGGCVLAAVTADGPRDADSAGSGVGSRTIAVGHLNREHTAQGHAVDAVPKRSTFTVTPATLNGLPLRGHSAVTRVADGAADRPVVTPRPLAPPQFSPDAVQIEAGHASTIAERWGAAAASAPPQLVYLPMHDRPILAWEVALGLRLAPTPSLVTVWVSARTGAVLKTRDDAFGSDARVFEENPVSTPDPIDVALTTIDVAEAGASLQSSALDVFGCGPTPGPDVPGWWAEPQCAPTVRARSDADGNFFVALPDIGRVRDNAAVDDAYAEVAAYRAAEHFFTVMEARGLTMRRCERFAVLVNNHSLSVDGEVVPIGGASYVDSCNPDVTPQLIVGQGPSADYAYDADVLYHELGHSVVQSLSPDGLTDRAFLPVGILSEAGAINEGVADYFAMTVADDPDVAEYVGLMTRGGAAPYLRTGTNTAVCPDDLTGQWHGDGRIIGAALWSIRTRLGIGTDTMVLRALVRSSSDTTLQGFAQALAAVAQTMADEGLLDAAAVEFTNRILAARGLLDCQHVIDDPALVTTGKRMHFIAADAAITPYAPGPLQLRYVVPDDEHEVTLFFSSATGTDDVPVAATFLVKRHDSPIAFSYQMMPGDDDASLEVLHVQGDHDVELPAESLNGEDFIARLPVSPAEVLHVALANQTPTGTVVGNFFVTASEPTMRDDDDDASGCACGTAPQPMPAAPWMLMALIGLLSPRRSSTDAPPRR